MADLINTTYNFGADSDQTEWFATGFPANSENLQRAFSWYPNNDTNYPEQITSAANYSGGGGGRGQRHWFHDSNNAVSGGVLADFLQDYAELWIRVYIKFQAGFNWGTGVSAHTKLLYLHDSAPYCAPGFVNNVVGIQTSIVSNCDSTTTWQDVMGGDTSDGLWHCYEWHVKMDTNGADGIAQCWLDNVLILDKSNIDWGTGTGWNRMEIGENHTVCDNANGPIGSAFAYIDFDDLVVSDSARVGPLAGNSIVRGSQMGGLG